MKNILLIFIIFIFSFSNIYSSEKDKNKDKNSIIKTEIVGIIKDYNTNERLTGVKVKIKGTNLETYTDFDGKFSFKNINNDKVNLVINYISYENKEISFNKSDNNLIIKIKNK